MAPNSGNKILIKRSNLSSKVPDLSALSLGELGVNTHDGKIFTRTETSELTSIKTFLNSDDFPYVYNEALSGVIPKEGNNSISEVFANVLGGYNNNVSGAASTTINGEDNDIESDFSIIGGGLNNKIKIGSDYSFNAAGQNNLISHSNVFTLGSNLSSHSNNFTYVNNISATGKLYGDGSELTGIVGGGGSGDENVNTLVKSNSATWDATSILVSANSGMWSPIRKFDIVYSPNTISYSGTAPSGSLTSQNVWSIVRIIFTNSGTVSAEKTAFHVAWDNRLILNYF